MESLMDTDRLAELIDRKHRCLLELRQLGEKQLELVRDSQMTELLHVLAYKQRQIGVLQAIQRGLAPFGAQEPGQRRWRTAQDREECARKLAECEGLLAEIVSQEKCSESELVRRRDEAAIRLQGAHAASQARSAYASQAPGELGQVDLLSEQ